MLVFFSFQSNHALACVRQSSTYQDSHLRQVKEIDSHLRFSGIFLQVMYSECELYSDSQVGGCLFIYLFIFTRILSSKGRGFNKFKAQC